MFRLKNFNGHHLICWFGVKIESEFKIIRIKSVKKVRRIKVNKVEIVRNVYKNL